MTVKDLGLHKRRMGNAQDVTPEELLRMVLEDVADRKNGVVTRLVVIAVTDEGEGREGVNVYRCNMDRPEQLGYLAVATHQGIHFWCNDADE